MKDFPNNIKEQIGIAAYFLSEKNHPYDTLCWMLAERQLYVESKFNKPHKEKIRERAAKLFHSQPSYDVLCWLISEIDFLLNNKIFKKNRKMKFNL